MYTLNHTGFGLENLYYTYTSFSQIMQYCSVFAEFELLTLMATFLPSLHLGVEYGTIIGIGVDLLMLTFHHAKPSVKVYNKWNFFF